MNDQPIGKIKLGVELEGTSFGNNLDEINAKIKQAESSMKANLKAFDNAGKSYDGLNQKVKDLTTVMSGQDAKIVALNKRRDEAIEKYGKESKQVINLNTQINNATAKYNGFEKQLNTAKKELAYASTEVNALTKEMKDNEKATQEEVKALKLAGDEAGALELQQQGLEKQLDLTKRATVEQQKVVESLTQEFGANSTEVENAKSNLEKLGRQTKITETQLSSLSESTKDTADTFDNSGDSVGVFQGALMADFATDGLDKIKDVVGSVIESINEASEQYNILKAQLGSGADITDVQTSVSNVFAQGYGEDIEEVQQALTAVKQLMPDLNGKELEDMTARALTFSKATDTDLNESIKGARTLMNEFQISSVDAFDLMNKGAQNGLNFSGDLADQLSEFAPIFSQAGYDANEMFAMMNNGLDGGAYNLDKVNDLMNEFTTRLDDGTISESMGLLSDDTQKLFEEYKTGGATASEMFNAVVGDINNMENQTDKASAASVMFGSLGEDSSLKMVLGLTKVNDKYKDVQGTSDDVNSSISNSSPFEALKRNLQSSIMPLAESMSGVKSKITDVINSLFQDFPTATKVGLGIVAGIIATMAGAFAIAVVPAGIFTTIMGGLATAIGVLTSPITLTIAGIGLLVGAFILAYQKIEPFRNVIDGLIDKVKEFSEKVYNQYIKPTLDEIVKAFTDFGIAVKTWWDVNGAQFVQAISNVLGFIWNLISPFLNKTAQLFSVIFKAVAETVMFAWDIIKNQTQGFFQVIKGLLDIFTGVFTGNWKKVWNGVKSIFSGAFDILTSWFRTRFVKKITDSVVAFVRDIPQKFSNMWTTIKRFFSDGINTLVKRMKDVPSKIAEGISKNAYKVVDAFKSMFKKAQQAIKKPVNMVIGGANWVLKKFGAKEIPTWNPDEKYAKGTPKGGHKGGSALVNDGNGAEMVIMPNGQSFIPKGKNVLIPNAPVGMHVMNAQDTALAMSRATPTFAYKNGTSWWDDTKNFVGNMGKWAKEKVSNVWDFVSNPSKLVEIALSKFVDFGDTTGFALDAGKGLVGKAKDSMFNWVKDLFSTNDQGGVFDGSTDSQWGVFSYLKDIADKAISKFGEGLRITSGYRAGDPHYHGKRQAIDIALPASMNGSSKNKTIANWVYDNFKKQVAYVITNGKVRDRSGFSGTGQSGNWVGWPSNDHYDHVHINGLLNSSNVTKAVGKTYANSVEKWRSIASQALQMEGQYSSANLNALMNQIRTESNGNQYAINNWDINAKNGTPSKGLLQVIDPTFRAYARSGYNSNIYDPLSNILASIRYARSRYGSLTSAYRGVGYANGGFITKQHLAMVGEGNNPEVVIPLANAKRSRAMELLAKTKSILGDKDAIIVNNNNDNNNLKSLESKFDMLINIATALLDKEVAVNLDGRKLNKAMEDIKTRNAIQKNRGGGLITA